MIPAKNDINILTPSEFQDTLQLAHASIKSKYFRDFVNSNYPDVTDAEDISYLYKEIQATSKEIIFDTYKTVLKEFSPDKQQEYLQRMNANDWIYIIVRQIRSGYFAELLNESIKAFHRYASPDIQKQTLSNVLYWEGCRSPTIGLYMQELYRTASGRQTLKEIGQNFTEKNWEKIIPEDLWFVVNKNASHSEINVIQYMCGIRERCRQFTETDWLHLADYYDDPKLIGSLITECTASHGWNKIKPDSLIDWCQKPRDVHWSQKQNPNETISVMISEWADNHAIDGKIDMQNNLSVLYFTALNQYRTEPRKAVNSRTVIIEQMGGQLPIGNDDQQLTKKQRDKINLLTERQWYEVIERKPELLPYAIENHFGARSRPHSLKSLFIFIKQRCIEFIRLPNTKSRTDFILNYSELYPFMQSKWEQPAIGPNRPTGPSTVSAIIAKEEKNQRYYQSTAVQTAQILVSKHKRCSSVLDSLRREFSMAKSQENKSQKTQESLQKTQKQNRSQKQ